MNSSCPARFASQHGISLTWIALAELMLKESYSVCLKHDMPMGRVNWSHGWELCQGVSRDSSFDGVRCLLREGFISGDWSSWQSFFSF